MERIEPFGGHIDDVRAVMGSAAIINTMRRMFGGDSSDLLQATALIPWYKPEPEKLLHDPADPDYDAEEHAAAIMKLLAGKATKAAQ